MPLSEKESDLMIVTWRKEVFAVTAKVWKSSLPENSARPERGSISVYREATDVVGTKYWTPVQESHDDFRLAIALLLLERNAGK